MRENNSILRKPAVQTLLASLVCIVLGVLIGFIALLIIIVLIMVFGSRN